MPKYVAICVNTTDNFNTFPCTYKLTDIEKNRIE